MTDDRSGSKRTFPMFSERPTNFLQQQGKFDDFIDCFNNERPHQALGMQCPVERKNPEAAAPAFATPERSGSI